MCRGLFKIFFKSSKAAEPLYGSMLYFAFAFALQEDNEKWKTPVFIILASPQMCALVHWEKKKEMDFALHLIHL